MGVFNVCVRALNVLDTEPLPFFVPILLSTESGTAGMGVKYCTQWSHDRLAWGCGISVFGGFVYTRTCLVQVGK